MPDITQIQVGTTTYDIKDNNAFHGNYIALTTNINSISSENPIIIKQIKSWSTGTLPTLSNNIEVINSISFNSGVFPTFSYDSENTALIISTGTLPSLISTTTEIPNIINVGTLPELISEDQLISNFSTTTQIVVTGISKSN